MPLRLPACLSGYSSGLISAPADPRVLQETWRTAIGAGDVATLQALYSDDLVYVHSDGRIQTKEEFLAPVRAGKMRLALTPCDTPRVRSYEHAAVVSSCYEIKSAGGASRHLFLTVYVNQANTWRIVSQQTTRLPDPR